MSWWLADVSEMTLVAISRLCLCCWRDQSVAWSHSPFSLCFGGGLAQIAVGLKIHWQRLYLLYVCVPGCWLDMRCETRQLNMNRERNDSRNKPKDTLRTRSPSALTTWGAVLLIFCRCAVGRDDRSLCCFPCRVDAAFQSLTPVSSYNHGRASSGSSLCLPTARLHPARACRELLS